MKVEDVMRYYAIVLWILGILSLGSLVWLTVSPETFTQGMCLPICCLVPFAIIYAIMKALQKRADQERENYDYIP
jgi:uncharacterized membrane protein YqjE